MESTKKLVEVFCRITEPAIMIGFFSEIFTPVKIDDFIFDGDFGEPEFTVITKLTWFLPV